MKIELRAVDTLKPYERNARIIPQKAVDKVAASIKAFGFRVPLSIAPDGTILAGHTRLLAAKQLKMKKVPCDIAEELTKEQQAAYRLADNRTHDDSKWDEDILVIEMADLREAGFDISLTGFEQSEIDRILSGRQRGEKDPEETPPPPAKPITKLGDTWLLGSHRLRCGDSTNAEAVAALLGMAKPVLMVTDPPYGIEYEPEWRAEAGVNKNKKKLGKVSNDDRADWREAWALFPGSIAYVWHADKRASEVQASLEATGFVIRCQIVWAKDRFALSRGDYHWQHEPCWYAVKGKGHWKGNRSQSTLWEIPARDDGGHGHGTQKPIECMKRPIENNTTTGQAVYDPFLGSGTTLIAAEMTDRVCYGMELDPAYCDVIVRRWEEFTGQKAVREEPAKEKSRGKSRQNKS